MDCGFDIILDLATDNTDEARKQLINAIESKVNGATKHKVSILARNEDKIPIVAKRVIASDDNIDLMFKAKCALDKDGVTDFVLVTPLLAKKYWERVCLHMFAALHCWTVLGVDIDLASSPSPLEDKNVAENINAYLTKIGSPQDVEVFRSSVIPEKMFNAGFHKRFGGVSHLEPVASLNMTYVLRKPDPVIVIKENRRRLAMAAGFDLDTLYIAKCEHKAKIWVVGKEEPDRYDGIVTNIPGVTVAAPGADCCMTLLADTKTGACGAVHAGWMGTVAGAVKECLKTMVREFETNPKDVHVAIGPSVEATCFDLPASDAAVVTALDPSLTWPSQNKDHDDWVHMDLVRANALMLQNEGVQKENIDTATALCTVCHREFFSHKRDGYPFGNQIGFISCRKSE